MKSILMIICLSVFLHGCTAGMEEETGSNPGTAQQDDGRSDSGTKTDTHTVEVTWHSEEMDVDENPLPLAGYSLEYGTVPGQPENRVTITGGSVNSAEIANLPPGQYFFTVTSQSIYGSVSEKSDEYPFEVSGE